MKKDLPIGVFDSGIGGLTVLNALIQACPNEDYLYLGDTARLPYGTKSPDTVIRYAEQATKWFLEKKIKLLVIACNTASTLALDSLNQKFPDLPIIGVVKPGANTAINATQNQHILVIGTQATIQAGGYSKALNQLSPQVKTTNIACQLFVSLAEEGWHQHDITQQIAHVYFKNIFDKPSYPDTLLLGCTHFPLLIPSLKKVIPADVSIIDSASTIAHAVHKHLQRNTCIISSSKGQTHFFITDIADRFIHTAENFLGQQIQPAYLERIDLIS